MYLVLVSRTYNNRSLVTNIADIEHDPNETLRKDYKEIKFDWE